MKANTFWAFACVAIALSFNSCVCSQRRGVILPRTGNEAWSPQTPEVYPTFQEKSQLRQGVALTCSNKFPLRHHLYSQTLAGSIFHVLSDPLVHVSKPLHASARVEVLITPLLNGRPFSNLESFLQQAIQPAHVELTTASVRAIYRAARVFGLSCGGYRVEADNLHNPFSLRIVAGELLGPVLVSKAASETRQAVVEAAKRTQYVIGLSLRNHRGSTDQVVNQVSHLFGKVFKGFESVRPYQRVLGDPTRGFFKGCLFTDWTDKGETLVNFLGRSQVYQVLQSKPHQVDRVVFIDDHFDNCWSVKRALERASASLGIKESISLYYKPQTPTQRKNIRQVEL